MLRKEHREPRLLAEATLGPVWGPRPSSLELRMSSAPRWSFESRWGEHGCAAPSRRSSQPQRQLVTEHVAGLPGIFSRQRAAARSRSAYGPSFGSRMALHISTEWLSHWQLVPISGHRPTLGRGRATRHRGTAARHRGTGASTILLKMPCFGSGIHDAKWPFSS